jgi:hypothetical protein
MLHMNCIPCLFCTLFTDDLLNSSYTTGTQGREAIVGLERDSMANLPLPLIGGEEAPIQTRTESHYTIFGLSNRSLVGTIGLQ